jgi:hypothetical protein
MAQILTNYAAGNFLFMRPITMQLGLGIALMVGGTILVRADGPATTGPAPAPAPSAATPAPAGTTPAPATATPAATPAPAPSGAKIQFETPTYDFGRAKSGDAVKHTFTFKNTGCETLEINNVRPGCGCTTAGEWTKKVEPGGSGEIPIQVNTANFNGPIMKNVSVDSNDKSQPTTVLYMKGTVWKPIEINPQFAMINVPPDGEAGSTVVRIINNMDEPITLSKPEVNNPSFTATLKTNQPGKEFEMVVSVAQPIRTGYSQAQVTVKTSSSTVPTLSANIGANVQAAVTVIPAQITLPPGPLANQTMPSITIQNNATNMMTLSDWTTTAKDVQVKLSEANPGHLFTATLTFPQGYELPQGDQAVFTVKTSNPQYAVLKVPITQMQRPQTPLQPVPLKTSSGLQIVPAHPGSQVAGSSKVEPPLQPLPIKGQ